MSGAHHHNVEIVRARASPAGREPASREPARRPKEDPHRETGPPTSAAPACAQDRPAERAVTAKMRVR